MTNNEKNKDIKDKLLEYVGNIKRQQDFWRKYSKKIGNSNIRTLALTALNTESYKELRLFIEYKIAKGNGWDCDFNNKNNFGQQIIAYMDEIYELSGKDDRNALANISKFFGYLYWEKKIIEYELRGNKNRC